MPALYKKVRPISRGLSPGPWWWARTGKVLTCFSTFPFPPPVLWTTNHNHSYSIKRR